MLEKTIIDALRKYLESIRLVFSDNLKKVAKITNLFNSHFSSIMLLHYNIEDVAEIPRDLKVAWDSSVYGYYAII